MVNTLKQIPLALSSLVLALFSLSRLFNQNVLLSQGIWFLASFFLLILFLRLSTNLGQSRQELKNPIVASCFSSFFMALFFFTSDSILTSSWGILIWSGLLLLYLTYISYFSYAFLRKRDLKTVYPSWFVVYVGPAISVVVSPFPSLHRLGLFLLLVTGIAFIILLPFVSWRLFKHPLSQGEKPLLAILAAPLALLITAYTKWTPGPQPLFLGLILIISQLLFLFAILAFIRQLGKGFTPLFAAYSFPLVSSATALKSSLLALGLAQGALGILITIESLMALIIIGYITLHFTRIILLALPNPFATRGSKAETTTR